MAQSSRARHRTCHEEKRPSNQLCSRPCLVLWVLIRIKMRTSMTQAPSGTLLRPSLVKDTPVLSETVITGSAWTYRSWIRTSNDENRHHVWGRGRSGAGGEEATCDTGHQGMTVLVQQQPHEDLEKLLPLSAKR